MAHFYRRANGVDLYNVSGRGTAWLQPESEYFQEGHNCRPHSVRNASKGETRVPRRAGRYVARAAAAISTIGDTVSTTGSNALTSNIATLKNRPSRIASGKPTATPTIVT